MLKKELAPKKEMKGPKKKPKKRGKREITKMRKKVAEGTELSQLDT